MELWKTDGTESGTQLVKDIRTGTGHSQPQNLFAVSNQLFFAADDGSHGEELWVSNGTSAGTSLVKDIVPGFNSSTPIFGASLNGILYFSAFETASGRELWRSNGTTGGTYLVKDINPGADWSLPTYIAASNGSIFFSAYTTAYAEELWKSDGTGAGTVLVKDIAPLGGSTPGFLSDSNGTLYFCADETGSFFYPNSELWKSDGTGAGTALVKDISHQVTSLHPNELVSMLNVLYFFGVEPGARGLFKSDGTEAGTTVVKDILFWEKLSKIGNQLYFAADNQSDGYEPWSSDGSEAGTVLVADVNPGPMYSLPHNFAGLNGFVYFSALFDPDENVAFFRTDGTPSGTVSIANYLAFAQPMEMNGNLYFVGGYGDLELWKSDGTSEGTHLLKIINPGGYSDIGYLTEVTGVLFFSADDGIDGIELWKSDGTEEGTQLVKDIFPGPEPTASGNRPQFLTNVNGTLFFAADDGVHGMELWKSDGTDAGTTLVKDIFNGPIGSFPQSLFHANGVLYFAANDGSTGHELWRSDGTENGTFLVKDIHAGLSCSMPQNFVVTALGRVIFVASDGLSGLELWQTDGTSQGTSMIQDIAPGQYSSNPSLLTLSGSLLYFSANDNQSGDELWAMPFSAPGTVPDGSGASVPLTVIRSGNQIILSWDDSCNTYDTDYEIYEGTIGQPNTHTRILCTTNGASTATITPSSNDSYYLVVPRNATQEGSYGSNSSGSERPQGAIFCLPQAITPCL